MDNKGKVTYKFELKDLTYLELYEVYKEMIEFVSFLTKTRDTAEVVKEEKVISRVGSNTYRCRLKIE